MEWHKASRELAEIFFRRALSAAIETKPDMEYISKHLAAGCDMLERSRNETSSLEYFVSLVLRKV